MFGKQRGFDVITVGSATIDVFVYTDKSQLINIRSEEEDKEFIAYPSGSKLLIQEMSISTGGGGTNSAVALARMGLSVGYLSVLGNDANSRTVLGELKHEKVRFLGYRAKGSCGYSVILDSIEHDRTILTYKGLNDTLSFRKLNRRNLKAKWFYFSSMTNNSYKALEDLSEFAKENGIKVAFNPSSYLAEQGADFLSYLLSKTDALILNKEEAGLITRKKDVLEMLKALKQLCSGIIIITNGKEGAHAYFKGFYYFIAAHKVPVVEATGAGDAFASSFIGALIKAQNFEDSLRIGLADAESVLTHRGSKGKLLAWKELYTRIRKKPARIVKKKVAF